MPDPTPFEFDFGDHEPTLEAAVYQAVGAASACWENLRGAGVFDSTRAKAVAEALLAYVREHTDPKHAPKSNPDAYLVPPKETR